MAATTGEPDRPGEQPGLSAVSGLWRVAGGAATVAADVATVILGAVLIVTRTPMFLRRYRQPDPQEFIPLWFREP